MNKKLENQINAPNVLPEVRYLVQVYQFEMLPGEDTFYKNTYHSAGETPDGRPLGTAMIGMYCEKPLSLSRFHRLKSDEVWHFYAGDSFELVLLYPDGTGKHVKMGGSPLSGSRIQFTIPAGTWQAGALISGGKYALYGCTMTPGFDSRDFEIGSYEELIREYPSFADEIRRLSTPLNPG